MEKPTSNAIDAVASRAPNGRSGTWTPARQSSISALIRLASTVSDARLPTRDRRARTLYDTVGPRRTRNNVQRGRRATTGQLPTVVRWVTTFAGQPVEPTFWCQICFENVAVSEALTLEPCDHQYCRQCFAAHLEQKLEEGDAFPVCFHPVLRDEDGENDRLYGRRTCGTAVPASAIVELCGVDVWARYAALRDEDKDEDSIERPYCYYPQTLSHSDERDAVCLSCSRTYCTLHGSAHEDSACGDYELSVIRDHRVHHAAGAKNAKACPTCSTSVEKTGDCNHMRCLVCTTSFCWLCGDHIDDSALPSHYDWTGQSACRGKQWDTATTTSQSDQVLGVVWTCLETLFCIPVAIIWTAMVYPATRCCRKNATTFDQAFGETRAVCEQWFRTSVHFAVFLLFRSIVLCLCLPLALVLTLVLKTFTCIHTKPWRRFFEREFVGVLSDLDLMLATMIFTLLCAVAIGLAMAVGAVVRTGELALDCFNRCRPGGSALSDTVRVESDQDTTEAPVDLEKGTRQASLPGEETPYHRVQEP